MSFLDENGLAYFYGKLKEKFIQSVNSQTPDASGNVNITNVATADNLTSPDAQASYGTFIYRTSGGNTSLSSGEAQLVYVDGNIDIVGRVSENFVITTTNDINLSYSANIWRSQISEDGTYVFTYTKPTSSTSAMSWTASGTWTYESSQVSLASFGLYPANIVNPSISIAVSGSGSGVTAATVVPSTFFGQINTDGITDFWYSIEDVSWMLGSTSVSLGTYGIAITGSPLEGDTISVTSIFGTPNSTVTIDYTAPQQGTINVATPATFSATGFNQFDKNSMVLTNASFNNGTIVQNTGTYACYCRAKGGVDNGYVAYSESGKILDIAWCATVPTIGASIITTGQSVSSSLASIPFNDDGYVIVITSSTADICIHPKWSGAADTEYEEYVAPSVITIPTKDTSNVNLPTATYGMPRIGAVADRLNLDAGTYIQNIGRLENTSSNMDYVVGLATAYDYDDNYIYYVLSSPITYNVNVDSVYTVNDWGTEEFTGTEVALGAQTLYGQNLRDKLRTDVVTISAQSLTQNQKNQVCTNIGAVKNTGDVIYGSLQLHVEGNPALYGKNTSADTTRSSDTTARSWLWAHTDKNGSVAAYWQTTTGTTGSVNTYYKVRKNYSGGTFVDNGVIFSIDQDGNKFVTLDAPTAWRTALGFSNNLLPISLGGTGQTAVTHITTASQIITKGSNITIVSTAYHVWGKLAHLNIALKADAAIASGSVVATLVSGKEPTDYVWLNDNIGVFYIHPNNRTIVINHTINAGSTIYMRATYMLK